MEQSNANPTFTTLILGKTWSNTKRFFKSVRRDLLITIVPAAFGFLVLCLIKGLKMALSDLLTTAAFTFGPIGFACVVVMLWYFLIAPAELAYESAKARFDAPPPGPRVNWLPWKGRTKFNVNEFAAILAKTDPGSLSIPSDQMSFRSLLLEQIEEGNLEFIRKYQGNREKADEYSEITRKDALRWAKEHQLDVSHIK